MSELASSKSKSSFLVSCVQMVSGEHSAQNIARAEHLIEKAKKAGGTVVALPENFATYGKKQKPSLQEQESFVFQMSALAKQYAINIVAGSYPLSLKEFKPDSSSELLEKHYASCLVFGSDGNLKTQYNKIHLFDAQVNDSVKAYKESDEYKHGDAAIKFDIEGVCCGIAICYDLRFSELFIALTKAGSRVIFVPSAFTVPTGKAHWELLLRTRAVETQCYIVAPNQGGEHPRGRATWGHSMIVSPWGEVLESLAFGEGLITAALDFEVQDEIRRKMPVSNHRRLV